MKAPSDSTVSMRPIHVTGHAVWAPGFRDAQSFFAREEDASVVEPPLAFVNSRLQRAISLMCRMAVQVVGDAIEAAGIAPDQCATVFGSSHGEMQIAVDQMVMMQEGEGRLSPARFKNSVHNTAAGLFSIASGNRGFTTAVAGGAHTFPLALLEGAALIASGEQTHAVVAIADEPLPEPLSQFGERRAIAAAVVLSSASAGSRGQITLPARSTARPESIFDYGDHPVASALRLLFALNEGQRGAIALTDEWGLVIS